MNTRPDIYAYVTYHSYLHDLFLHCKKQDGISLRSLRIPKGDGRDGEYSAAFINKVLLGQKPIPEAMLPEIARAFGLSQDEFTFLEKLVDYTHANDPLTKREAYRALAKRRSFRDRQGIGSKERLQFILHGYIGDIYLMTALSNFVADATWISTRLLQPVTQSQVDDALEVLHDLGLIELQENGCVQRVSGHRPEPKTGETMLFQLYHQEQCEKAKLALDQLDRSQRNFVTLGISRFDSDGFALFQEELGTRFRALAAELAEKYECKDTIPASEEVVAQINLQSFRINTEPGQ